MARYTPDSGSLHRAHLVCSLLLSFTASLCGCIRPQNYHALPSPSAFHYTYLADKSQGYGTGYFSTASAYLSYVEFDERGGMYRDQFGKATQLDAAIGLINAVKNPPGGTGPRKIALFVFVHGWKNNASEDVGNVWGFRRFLSDIAAQQGDIPVIGVYMGWPGASLKGDQFLSFWNREPIADNVGQSRDFRDALKKVLQAAKGDSYDSPEGSFAVVIGHSFGAVVLEHAATSLIQDQIDKSRAAARNFTSIQVLCPADLFVLINEAGAAAIARPFLLQLKRGGAQYTRRINGEERNYPLLLSMTSVGDVATKFGYPGGEFLSFNRAETEDFSPPDDFGQASTLPYNLITAANMVALQSHQIVPVAGGGPRCDADVDIPIRLTSSLSYCMKPLDTSSSRNHTPYWIMQLPQIFVPDHSSVFQDYLLYLLTDVLANEQLIAQPNSKRLPSTKSPSLRPMQAPLAAGSTQSSLKLTLSPQ